MPCFFLFFFHPMNASSPPVPPCLSRVNGFFPGASHTVKKHATWPFFSSFFSCAVAQVSRCRGADVPASEPSALRSSSFPPFVAVTVSANVKVFIDFLFQTFRNTSDSLLMVSLLFLPIQDRPYHPPPPPPPFLPLDFNFRGNKWRSVS